MARSGGRPIVADESAVVRAADLAQTVSGIDASPTGAAGLAGLIAARDRIADDERVAVIFSGIRR
jgi:threonine dehydratase